MPIKSVFKKLFLNTDSESSALTDDESEGFDRFGFRRLSGIDGYVFFEILGPFLGGVFFFLFIFLMFQALRLADFLINHGVGWALLGKFAGLLCVSFLPIVLPVAFLIAVLMGFGRLSADSELVAMKASGFSLPRLILPAVGLAFFVAIFSWLLHYEWVPVASRTFKSTLIKVSSTKVVSSIREGTFTAGFFDLLLYTDKVDQRTNRMERVFIFDERDEEFPLTVVAREGNLVPLKPSGQIGSSAILRLKQGNIHRNDIQEATYQTLRFNEYFLFLDIPEGSAVATVKPRMLPFKELVQKIESTKEDTKETREWKNEYWRRFSVGLTPFIFLLVGAGFGTFRTRSVRSGAAVVAFSIIALHWGLQAFASIAAQKAWMPPWFTAQIPNMACLILGVYAFRKSNW